MDKETLSHYGWIVILVLILAVLLALASPFGNFVAGAIKATTAGFFSVNKNALDIAGIVMPDQEFDEPDTNPTPVVQPEPVPVLNEYGFYYNKIYSGTVSGIYNPMARVHNFEQFTMFFPGEDGKPYAVSFIWSGGCMMPDLCTELVLGDNDTWEDGYGSTYYFFENGTKIEVFEGGLGYGGILTFNDEYNACTSKYETPYTNEDTGEVYVLHEDNTVTITDTNGVTNTYKTKWISKFMLKVEGYKDDIYLSPQNTNARFPSEW